MSLAKNSVLYLISTICLKAVGFLLLPLYTHLVSPAEYGYVYVVSAFQTFMGLFLTLSMHGAIGRFYFDCKNVDEIKHMYSQQVIAITLSASFITALMLIFKSMFSQLLGLPEKYYLYAVLISYFSLFYNLVIALLYAMEQAVRISVTSIAVGASTIVMQLVLVFTMDDKAMALIFAMFFAAVVTFIIFIIYSAPYFAWPRFNKSELVKFYKYSISQLPSDVSVWFVAASDRLLLNKIQGASAAGVYGMGNTLGQIPTMLFHSVNKAYVPYVFRHYKESEEGRREALNEVADTAIKVESLLTVVVVSLIILSNNIVSLLESRYIESAIIMPLVLIAVWVDCNRIIFMNPLAYNIKYIKVKSLIWVLAAVLDVGLNLYLIPRYSVYGACASLIISYGVSCALILHYSKKAMNICYDGRRLTAVFSVSLLFALSYFIGNNLASLIFKLPIIIIYLVVMIYINNMQGIIKRLFTKFMSLLFHIQRYRNLLALLLMLFLSVNSAYPKSTIYDEPNQAITALFNKKNCKYVIKYNHIFHDTITIPTGCELLFEGGTLKGPIVFDNTLLKGDVKLQGSSLSGKVKNTWFESSWLCYMDDKHDDAKNINQMIYVCGKIHFQKGTYLLLSKYVAPRFKNVLDDWQVDTHIGIATSNVHLVGISDSIVFHTYQKSGILCIYTPPLQIEKTIRNIKIENITFQTDNNGKDFFQLKHAIKVEGVNGLIIKNCRILDFWSDAICLHSFGDTQSTGERTRNMNVIIKDNYIKGGAHYNTRNGIAVVSGFNVLIENNTIEQTSKEGMPGAIDVEANSYVFTICNITIKNNVIKDCKGTAGGICINSGGNEAPAKNVKIVNNYISGCTSGLAFVVRTENSTGNYYIRGNVVADDTTPYQFVGNGSSSNWIFKKNVFKRKSTIKIPGNIRVNDLVLKNNVYLED